MTPAKSLLIPFAGYQDPHPASLNTNEVRKDATLREYEKPATTVLSLAILENGLLASTAKALRVGEESVLAQFP